MADDQSRPQEQPEQDFPDPQQVERVRSVLAGLDFLRPDDPAVSRASDPAAADEAMPPWVWDRLTLALAAEADAPATRRTPAWMRWGGGLVAASVAVLAVGVAVTTFSDGSGSDQGPTTMSFAGMAPPALRLIDSETDYTAADLGAQVSTVLAEMGMEPEVAMTAMKQAPAEMPMPAEIVTAAPEPIAVLESPRSLRDCITKLTNLATSTALLIDWSTFDGQEAGVVVTPEYPQEAGRPVSEPDMSELDVWVIDHDCDVKAGIHIRMK